MVQGDEPMIHPDMISEALAPMLQDPCLKVVNLLGKIESTPSSRTATASRWCAISGVMRCISPASRFPTRSKVARCPMAKQVCVIPFRRDFLLEYTRTGADTARDRGVGGHDARAGAWHKLRMVPTQHDSHAVDTPCDLELVAHLMSDPVGHT